MGSHRLGLVVALVVAAGGAVTGPGVNAAPDALPLFTLTGAGATAADFTVARRTMFDPYEGVVRGTGRYAGFQLWELSKTRSRFRTGMLASRDLDARFRPAAFGVTGHQGDVAPITFGGVTLEPGVRYRVLLTSDGETEVRIPLPSGSDSITLTTTKPFRRTYTARTVAFRASDTDASVRIPIARSSVRKYFAYASLAPAVAERIRGATKGSVTACYTGRNASCADRRARAASGRTNYGYTPVLAGYSTTDRILDPWHRDARADASFSGPFDGTLTLVFITIDRP